MTRIIGFIDNQSKFNRFELLRKIKPETLILFSASKNNSFFKLKENIETILGIRTSIQELKKQSFLAFLNQFYQIFRQNHKDKFIIIGVGAPTNALLAAFVLGSFFDVRIYLQENDQEFTIPNHLALSLAKKKLYVLRIIEKEKPDSLEKLLTILLDRGILAGKRKNMRAKISYNLGIIEKNGLISINRGERGKLKINLTPIGKHLIKILD